MPATDCVSCAQENYSKNVLILICFKGSPYPAISPLRHNRENEHENHGTLLRYRSGIQLTPSFEVEEQIPCDLEQAVVLLH